MINVISHICVPAQPLQGLAEASGLTTLRLCQCWSAAILNHVHDLDLLLWCHTEKSIC